MSVRAVLLAVLAAGIVTAAYGLARALFARRAPGGGLEQLPTWSLRNPQMLGLVLFLTGSVVSISAMVLFLGVS